ncbi:MAG: RIP metalloprotease RseP [Chthoniobacterales bacterium]
MPAFLKFIIICLEVILIFNLLIVVHELGHFLAAKWRGLVVEKFAIWFGKPLWSKTIGGVEYRLGSIPAGGFVAIPQLAPMEAVEGGSKADRASLPPVKPLDKIIVAFAGPLFSLGLAFVFAVLVFFIGRPVSEGEMGTTIGYVLPDGPAAEAGLLAGDKILSVNNHPVSRFSAMGDVGESIIWNIATSEAPLIPIEVERDGATKTFEVAPITPERSGWGRKRLRQIGIAPRETPVIARIIANSPAATAGLKPQDEVTAVDGKPLLSMGDLAEYLDKFKGKAIALTVVRQEQGKTVTRDITVTPKIPEGETRPRIGIQWDTAGKTVLTHPNPISQVIGGITTMWATISAVVSPKSEINISHLSGPVGIMRLYYVLFESPNGWRSAIWFSVILNVNLAILNLLPFPVLDGGHITLAIIEAIRRKPISIRVLEIVQTAFALLLISFMIYVTFYDVLDLPFFGKSASGGEVPEMHFEPDAGSPAPSATPQSHP